MSLEHFSAFDAQVAALLDGLPVPDPSRSIADARQHYFAELSRYWLSSDTPDTSRRARMTQVLRQQLSAQIALRMDDHTLGSYHAELMSICINHPLPWQRQHLPSAQRPQIYRPVLDITSPNWRSFLHGAFVIVEGGPEGSAPDPRGKSEYALLYTLSHGVEAFDSLAELHVELCERLDDPHQRHPLLRLMFRARDRDCAANAERLRYVWCNDDMLAVQVQTLIDYQLAALTDAWQAAMQHMPFDWSSLENRVRSAGDLLPLSDSRSALQTRYSLLLERNSPSWLKNASAEELTHIMQTMQELVIAVDRARAPGILDLAAFTSRKHLLTWTRDRLREAIKHRLLIDIDPTLIHVSVTRARQTGAVVHPGMTSGWIPAASRPQTGNTVELVPQTYCLDELALLNISLLDIDYWITARVHYKDGRRIDGIAASEVRDIVRDLDVGQSYDQYLRTQLLTSLQGQWRRDNYVAISRARMRAELAKARYAGHLLEDPFERGYNWAKTVLDHPANASRNRLNVQRLGVEQLLMGGHTVQGVILITPDPTVDQRFLLYTPDAPDRRAWREYPNARELLKTLRAKPALRDYLKSRLPLIDHAHVERWLTQGGLGANLQRKPIEGDFQQALYRAEVQAIRAYADSSTNTKTELLGEFSLHAFSVLLDLVSFVLPSRALFPLALARALLCVIDTAKAFQEQDRVGVVKHLVETFTHVNDALMNISGTTVVRRAIRAIPPAPPLKLPPSGAVSVAVDKLHYRVDGIHKEGIYEQASPYPGITTYYIKDAEGVAYQVAFDGYRWRVIDPRMPDAYSKVPVKRREDGEWVVDSPVLWYDGLPDIQALLDSCRLPQLPAQATPQGAQGLYHYDKGYYLLVAAQGVPLRAHLLDDHYHLLLPGQPEASTQAWAILRWKDGQWRIRVRQAGRSSDWLALPASYLASLGSNRSSR